MTFIPELFSPDLTRDIDYQLIEATKGDGIIRCGTFMPCPVGDEAWVAVGPVAEDVLVNENLTQIFTVKWPRQYGIHTDVFAKSVARMRSFLRQLNNGLFAEPTGVKEDDVRFFVFVNIYQLIIPGASTERMRKDFERARAGARIVEELLSLGRPLRAITPEMESVTTGLLDAGLNPKSYVAYGNILRAVMWNLHYMLQTGTERVDMAFIREVLRVRPPSGWPRRRAEKDVMLQGHRIPAGDVVYVAVRATHLAAGGDFGWPRGLPEGALSFGAGRHRCPVKDFSERALLKILNGPGARPIASHAPVNAQQPILTWAQG